MRHTGNKLFEDVVRPAFAQKLASAGVRVTSVEECDDLMVKAAAIRGAVDALYTAVTAEPDRVRAVKMAGAAIGPSGPAVKSAADRADAFAALGAEYLNLPGVRDAALLDVAGLTGEK